MTQGNTDTPLRDIPFLIYYAKSKLLHAGVVFNLVWYASTIVIYVLLYASSQLAGTILAADFGVFYRAGELVWTSPEQLYTFEVNGLPYRYLPSFAIFMSWAHLIPFSIAYVMQVTLMLGISFLNLSLTYRLCQLYGLSAGTKNLEKTLAIAFIAPQHFVNMILGQVSHLFIVVVLSVLVALEYGRQAHGTTSRIKEYFIAGCLVGLAANIKPFALLFAPFLIQVGYSSTSKLRLLIQVRESLAAVSGMVLVLAPNAVFFWIHPMTVTGFIDSVAVTTLGFHHSTSITKLIIALIPAFDSSALRLTLLLALALPLFILIYRRYLATRIGEARHVHFFAQILFLLLIVYTDSWFLFLAIWYAILGPSLLLLYHTEGGTGNTTPIDRTWTIANSLLGYFVFGIVIHYLVLGFDPLIPPLLVIAFYYHELALGRVSDYPVLIGHSP